MPCPKCMATHVRLVTPLHYRCSASPAVRQAYAMTASHCVQGKPHVAQSVPANAIPVRKAEVSAAIVEDGVRGAGWMGRQVPRQYQGNTTLFSSSQAKRNIQGDLGSSNADGLGIASLPDSDEEEGPKRVSQTHALKNRSSARRKESHKRTQFCRKFRPCEGTRDASVAPREKQQEADGDRTPSDLSMFKVSVAVAGRYTQSRG